MLGEHLHCGCSRTWKHSSDGIAHLCRVFPTNRMLLIEKSLPGLQPQQCMDRIQLACTASHTSRCGKNVVKYACSIDTGGCVVAGQKRGKICSKDSELIRMILEPFFDLGFVPAFKPLAVFGCSDIELGDAWPICGVVLEAHAVHRYSVRNCKIVCLPKGTSKLLQNRTRKLKR